MRRRTPSGRALQLVVAVIATGTLLRVALAATIGMGVDESYATAVARTLSASYFDHPGLSFWIPGLVARVAGSENAVLLRAPFILMFAVTTWLVYRLGARLFGAWAGAYAALLLNVAPVFAVASGGWVLPDGPLDLFMVAAVLSLAHVFAGTTPHPTRWWALAGLAAALAALSKYQAVFLPIGLALYLATRREARRRLAGPGPYLAIAIAALGTWPTLAWNASHGWASFAFQFGRGAPSGGIHPLAMLENVAGQALYLLPWLWVPLLIVLARGLRRGPRDGATWLLCCMAAPAILFFTLISLGGNPGLPHWSMPGYLMVFPLLGAAVAQRMEQGDRRARRWLLASITGFAAVLALAWSQAATGWLTRVAPALLAKGDPTLEEVNWTDVRSPLARLGAGGRWGPFVAAVKWMDAGKIAFALGPGTPVLCLCGSAHHFKYVYDQRAFLGRDAVLLDHARSTSGVPRLYAPYFASIDDLPPIVIHRAGYPALTIQAFLGRDFRVVYPTGTR